MLEYSGNREFENVMEIGNCVALAALEKLTQGQTKNSKINNFIQRCCKEYQCNLQMDIFQDWTYQEYIPVLLVQIKH